MSVITAMAVLLGQAPSAPFGAYEQSIWAPTIPSESQLPGFGFMRYEGLNIETFGETEEQPRIQLLTRGEDYQQLEQLMEAAIAYLADQHDLEVTCTVNEQSVVVKLGYIRSASGIMYLGKNDADHHEFSTNFEVTYG